jgi:hypothetical protein
MSTPLSACPAGEEVATLAGGGLLHGQHFRAVPLFRCSAYLPTSTIDALRDALSCSAGTMDGENTQIWQIRSTRSAAKQKAKLSKCRSGARRRIRVLWRNLCRRRISPTLRGVELGVFSEEPTMREAGIELSRDGFSVPRKPLSRPRKPRWLRMTIRRNTIKNKGNLCRTQEPTGSHSSPGEPRFQFAKGVAAVGPWRGERTYDRTEGPCRNRSRSRGPLCRRQVGLNGSRSWWLPAEVVRLLRPALRLAAIGLTRGERSKIG